jgi:hypothetical protein
LARPRLAKLPDPYTPHLIYSMETTNTDFYAYRFKPVLSYLEFPSNGILIADEVGRGKTIDV